MQQKDHRCFAGERERGKEGKPITSNPPYGYVKSPEDKNLWLVDEEAAEVVRKIFRLTVEGMGPWQIAKRLTEEKVEKPSYYLATRQRGNFKTMCDFETPYNWTAAPSRGYWKDRNIWVTP